MTDDVPDEIELRLERWGQLARGRYENLGLSERSTLARLIAGDNTDVDWASQHLPDDVVETDRAIARLPPRYRRALKINYMVHLPAIEKAKILRTSPATFWARVKAGQVGVWMVLSQWA